MAEQNSEAVFQMQRVYIKDASLELPNAPQIFLEKNPPKIEVAVDVGAQRLAENIFESEVTVTVTAKSMRKSLSWWSASRPVF